MDLNQIFIKYYPEWTAFEAVVFFSVLIGVTAILLIQVLRKHIRWVQAVSVLLLVTYLMLVFGRLCLCGSQGQGRRSMNGSGRGR